MKRFDLIDGMRGYFLVFMLINHLVFAGGFWLVEINHRQFAFVEDAQGFVFLSGLLIGDEVAQGTRDAGGPVTIIGRGDLALRYQTAFAVLGIAARIAPPGMAQRGLWEIARMGKLA